MLLLSILGVLHQLLESTAGHDTPRLSLEHSQCKLYTIHEIYEEFKSVINVLVECFRSVVSAPGVNTGVTTLPT